MWGNCLLRRWFVIAGMVAGLSWLCGCQPETLLILLPQPDVEVPEQTPPFMMSTGKATQVYLLLGYHNVYSTGLIDLTDQMNAQGIHAKWLNDGDWQPLIDEIKQAHASGTLQGDLILVGHSFGGGDAVRVARNLNDDGIPVRLIALVDATNPPAIPANVDYCYNIYEPTMWSELFPKSFPGVQVKADPGNTHTEILNQPVTVEVFGPSVTQMNHFTIDSEPVIHQAIIDKIREIEASQPP